MGDKRKVLPPARSSGLIVQELPEETLVYDLGRHKAHCLNRASAIVWKQCDGKTTAGEAARVLGGELGAQVDEEVVWLALILSIASATAVQAASACGTAGQQCNTQPCCASAPFCAGPPGNQVCQIN